MTAYTPEQKREALELKRLKWNVEFDNDTLVCRALGIMPPNNIERTQQSIAILEAMKEEIKDE